MAYTMNGLNEVINMANNDTQVYIMDTQKKYYKLNEKGQLVIRSCFGRRFLPAFLPLPAYGSTERGG